VADQRQPIEHGSPDLFDWPAIGRRLAFVRAAPRRHPRLALAAFGACLALAVLAALLLPRTYRTEVRIMATRNLVMAALGNPGRAIPMDADAPTRGAADTIMRRASLVALVKQTNLPQRWPAARPAVLKLKDRLMSALTGPLDEESTVDALVYLLEQRLKVTTEEGIISIQVDWQDAQTAYLLVSSAQQDFLETRHALEVSTIAEAISILEGHAADLKARLEQDSQALRAARRARNGEPSAPARRVVQPSARREPAELASMRLMLAAKRRAVADLEGFRQRRLGELQAQLAELNATFTPAHPLIQATRESMESLSAESPQMAQLRREEQELLAQVNTLAGDRAGEADLAAAAATSPEPVLRRDFRTASARPEDDDDAETLRMQVNLTIQKYNSIVDRVEAARIELDTSRAAFKYRYSVMRPAEVPKKAARPNVPLTLVSGLLLGVIMAFGAPAWLDRRRQQAGAPPPPP
jgi:uncharacterized protein involved in exopolysaccharide biosynthesis